MKRIAIMLATVASLTIATGSVFAGSTTLQTFGTGTVVIGQDGDSVTIANDAGEYGGVYVKSKSQGGKLLSEVAFSFTNTGIVAGGAPRFSLPIDTDGKGKTVEGYAFIDVNSCGTNDVNTANSACQVYFDTEPQPYANWAAFAAAHPTWRTAPGAIPFIIADVAGSYSVDNIVLR